MHIRHLPKPIVAMVAGYAIVPLKYYFKAVPKEWHHRLPKYVKDDVALNPFM